MNERQVFTLKQVVSSIKKTISERYNSSYWVKAEMHKLNKYPSGHAFPELVQKEDGKIVAQINANIWKTQFEQINRKFIATVKEPLNEGKNLLLLVRVVYNDNYGISLQILDIDPSFSLGELQKERDETLKKLNALGILNNNQQLQLPLIPKRIALISADSSKGLSDFMEIIKDAKAKYVIETYLFQAYLQGDVAVDSILQALRKIKKIQHHFDAVLIIRGGGGEVGLSCYNNFQLCEAIATFPLPVLTGIGHSTNLTVAEMIAYRHAITPTKLAEFILENYQRFDHDLLKLSLAIGNQSTYLLQDSKHRFTLLTKAMQQIALQQNNRSKHELSFMIKNLGHLSKESINNQKYLTLNFKSSLKQSVFTFISQSKLELLQQEVKTKLSFQQNLNQQESAISTLGSIVKALDPAQVLKRGYSITFFNGKAIQEGQKLKKGDKITSLGSAFTLEATIENFQANENNKDLDKNQATS